MDTMGIKEKEREVSPFPAIVFPRPWIDDHHPVLISLGGSHPVTQAEPYRTLKIGQMSRED